MLKLYRFLRKEGAHFDDAVKELSRWYFKSTDWIIKNLMEAEETE